MNICVIGCGYVGLVTGAVFADLGNEVIGADVDQNRVDALNAGVCPIHEPGLPELLARGLKEGRLRFTASTARAVSESEVVFICVGTPPGENGETDLSQVEAATTDVARALNGYKVIVNKSTSPVGTGDFIRSAIEKSGAAPESFDVVCSPEFLREGQAVRDARQPDRIVIGSSSERAVKAVRLLYEVLNAPVLVTNTQSAELIKHASNAFLATKITFINAVANLCERTEADIRDVARGVGADSRIGPAFLGAGLGYGGSCFPKDVRALDYLASSGGRNLELLRAVISVNNRQRLLPWYALRERFNGQLAGVRVGALGLAFKPETDDLREAPSLALIEALAAAGAKVRAFDPQVGAAAAGRLPAGVELVDSPEAAAYQAQGVALLTEWQEIVDADWPAIAKTMRPPRFLFDGRNALDAARMEELGFEYRGVGRPGETPLEQQGDGARG